MKRVRILNTHFEGGEPKFVAGRTYPLTPETERMLVLGHAELAADDDEVGAEVESAPADQAAKPAAADQADAELPPPQPDATAAEPAAATPRTRRNAAARSAQPQA